VTDQSFDQDMMNGHLLACAAFRKLIASAGSDAELHSSLLQVSVSPVFHKKAPFLFLL